jgi:hypothetical protein
MFSLLDGPSDMAGGRMCPVTSPGVYNDAWSTTKSEYLGLVITHLIKYLSVKRKAQLLRSLLTPPHIVSAVESVHPRNDV